MNCEKIQVQIDNYLDGTLPEGEKSMLDSHVEGCVACKSVLKQEREFRSQLLQYEAPQAEECFADDVFGYVRNHSADQNRSMWKARGMGAIAASFIIFMVMIGQSWFMKQA